MRRFLLVLAGTLIALGVASAISLLRDTDDPDAAGPDESPQSDLTFRLQPGKGVQARTATLRCRAGDDAAACRALAEVPDEAFEPVPPGRACTEQYGGPEVVTVTGMLRGKSVDATFSRTDGCEISRFRAITPVLENLEIL